MLPTAWPQLPSQASETFTPSHPRANGQVTAIWQKSSKSNFLPFATMTKYLYSPTPVLTVSSLVLLQFANTTRAVVTIKEKSALSQLLHMVQTLQQQSSVA